MERQKNQGLRLPRQFSSGNSQERPSSVSRELANKGKSVVARLNKIKDINAASNEARLRAVETHNRDVTAIAYRGEPFVNDFFSTNRELHDLIPTIKTLYKQGAIAGTNPSVLEENDLFVQKLKGLSLMDIENMEVDPQTHELAPEDIRKINRMFRSQNLLGLGKDETHTFTLERLMYFASQQWAQPEIGTPSSLKKFQENITAYFDYYTSFLTDFNRDSLNESIMLIMLVFGRPYLPMAVASYVPAKLNITPSSAIKLYKQREELTDPMLKATWRRLEKSFFPVFKQAYRNNAFPEDLKQYQHYNEEVDYAAANILQSYMQKTVSAEDQLKKSDEVKTVLEQWDKHKRDVTREMMRQPNRKLEYQISKDHPGEKITMIKNRDTFVFIMHFLNNIHLTLEIDKTGKIFGIPPSLIKAYPHGSDIFITDLLTPLLEKYKVKDASNTVWQINDAKIEPPIASTPDILEESTQEEDQIIKPPKRKRLIPAVTIFESNPLPPLTPQAPKAKRFVAYSEDHVKELLGPQVSRQQFVVDQVLRTINNFEHGYTRGKLLKGHDRLFVGIRTGDYRIHLNRLGGENYTLDGVVNRRDAY